MTSSKTLLAPGKTVVKFGGSIISSDKRVEFSFREDVVAELSRTLASSGVPVALVHGGGAFGHPLAKRYHLSSSKPNPSRKGVTETRDAMFELNRRICSSLASAGLAPYTFSPFPLLSAAGKKGAVWLKGLLDAGMTPVTFGDVVHEADGFRIVSGDAIVREVSKTLEATRCIFVMDKDGILDPGGETIPFMEVSGARRFQASGSSDATGGIGAKVAEAAKMASAGTEVAFVSGFRPEEFAKALKRQRFHGTLLRVPSRD
ncbi:MAG: isopentenyl phosphate kinase [Thaumarchaeota archaeon]|nr:isopentenyl phosphate kinase [Nitrososphaerota archaeon]